MNFFNFKRKHWITVIVFLIVMIGVVAGFACFLETQIQKTRTIMRGYLIPEPFNVPETRANAQAQDPDREGRLSRRMDVASPKGACTSCHYGDIEEMSKPLMNEELE